MPRETTSDVEVLFVRLAEALQLRSEYQNKSESLRKRICDNLKVPQGNSPAEDPLALLKEMLALNDRLAELIGKINRRNHQTQLPDGRQLSDALIERDGIMKKRQLLSAIAESASGRDPRLHFPQMVDVRMTITLSMQDLYHQIEELSREFRELDNLIQSVNWSTEL